MHCKTVYVAHPLCLTPAESLLLHTPRMCRAYTHVYTDTSQCSQQNTKYIKVLNILTKIRLATL